MFIFLHRRIKQSFRRKRLSVFDCGEAPCPSQGERSSNKRKKGKSTTFVNCYLIQISIIWCFCFRLVYLFILHCFVDRVMNLIGPLAGWAHCTSEECQLKIEKTLSLMYVSLDVSNSLKSDGKHGCCCWYRSFWINYENLVLVLRSFIEDFGGFWNSSCQGLHRVLLHWFHRLACKPN